MSNSPVVIVVGGGNAGLVAAIASREAGARTVLLEASGREERGGNTRYASAVFRTIHSGVDDLRALVTESADVPWDRVESIPYTADAYCADVIGDAVPPAIDPDLVAAFVDASFAAAEWLRDHGVVWNLITRAGADPHDSDAPVRLPRGGELVVQGRGIGLVEALYQRAETVGVEIFYDAIVQDVILSAGAVTAVRLADHRQLRADSVIVASGGFEASADRRARHMGADWRTAKVRGTRFNTGDLMDRLLAQGAAGKGDWAAAHSVPIDTDAPPVGDLRIGDSTSRYSYPYGIMVNRNGRRFVDEGSDEMPFTYSELGRKIMAQPGGVAFQLFDAKTSGLLEERYSTATPALAGDIADLADLIGVDRDALVNTVSDYNLACDDGQFDPGIKDGLSSTPLEQPPKSNWAQRIDRPPYSAYSVTAGVTFTTGGGLATDTTARVIHESGQPISGLFAVGEIAGGFLRSTVPTGAGLMRGAAMAIVAARTAVAISEER